MSPSEALAWMLSQSGTSAYALSKKLGKSTGYISSVIAKSTDMSAGNLATMADAMGFDLVVRERGSRRKRVIDPKGGGADANGNQGPADER